MGLAFIDGWITRLQRFQGSTNRFSLHIDNQFKYFFNLPLGSFNYHGCGTFGAFNTAHADDGTIDVGKHGDTGRSDLDALRAVIEDEADVAAVGLNTWQALTAAGDDSVKDLEVVWESEPYTHCNFTALPRLDAARSDAWVATLMGMDWNDPEHRRILELEGLKQWVPTDLSGYDSLVQAMDAQGISDHW